MEAAQQPYRPAICPLNASEMKERCIVLKEELQVSSTLRWQIKEATHLQSHCNLWHQVRYHRIQVWANFKVKVKNPCTTEVSVVQQATYSPSYTNKMGG